MATQAANRWTAPLRSRAKRVLVVDDDKEIRELLAERLSTSLAGEGTTFSVRLPHRSFTSPPPLDPGDEPDTHDASGGLLVNWLHRERRVEDRPHRARLRAIRPRPHDIPAQQMARVRARP
jgi:hypothetical protein